MPIYMPQTYQTISKTERLARVGQILFTAAAREWIMPPYVFGMNTRTAFDFLEPLLDDVCKQYWRVIKRSQLTEYEQQALAEPILEIATYVGIILVFQGGFYCGAITDDLDTNTLLEYFNTAQTYDLARVWNTCSQQAPNRQLPWYLGLFPDRSRLDVVGLVSKYGKKHPKSMYGAAVAQSFNVPEAFM